MIWGETRKSRARPAPSAGPAAAQGMVRTAVMVMAGLAVTAAAAPALAAQHPGGPAASHTRPATSGQHTPASRMSHGPQWTHVAPGGHHTCATRANGTLWCWGDNDNGQLGIGDQTGQDRPRQVTTPAAGGWANVTAGGYHSCATRTNGTLWCWGNNAQGELGIGNQVDQDRPRQVTTPAAGGWASATAGYSQTCAIRTNRTLWCWGGGARNRPQRPQQVTTPALGGWAAVTVGDGFTCATRTNHTLWCWGANNSGQLGLGSRPGQQVTTPAPGGWASVHVGEAHTCATRTDGTLWCWGFGAYGQLGYPVVNDIETLPHPVTSPAPGGWASVTAGYSHTCAIRTNRALWCWGLNDSGQLGLGYYYEGPGAGNPDPQQVISPAAAGWATITAGFDQTCAIRTGGTLWCWGLNDRGQLGIGSQAYFSDLPQQVTCGHPAAGHHRPAEGRSRPVVHRDQVLPVPGDG
jgi:Regulator of chromosome condensation (RCC1) repeat